MYAFVKLVAKSPLLNALTKELALELSEFAHPVLVYEHIPGVSNVIADALSRNTIPRALEGVIEVTPPVRDDTWWLLGSK